MSESFHVNLSFSGSVVLEEKSFNDLTPFLHFFNYLQFDENLVLFGQFLILFTQGWFVRSLGEIGLLVLEKKIVFNILVNTCKYGFS
jgi:hypothetical protein